MKKRVKRALCILLAGALFFLGNLESATAAENSDAVKAAYDKKVETLKKKERFKDGIYTATVKSAKGEKALLVTDYVFGEEPGVFHNNAIAAWIYQYVDGKVVYIGKITSTGTGYPLCRKGKYLLSGYHHESYRYAIKNGKAIIEELTGLYNADKYGYYTKYSMKKNKWKKLERKRLKKSVAEAMNYYSDGNFIGTPISFQKR